MENDRNRAPLRRRPAAGEDDITRELRAHVELEIEDQLAEGARPDEARAAALRTVGNVTLAVERVRDLSPWAWWQQAQQDLRYASRTMRRAPAFAITAIVTLALGIGANGAIFSVVDALVLRPLPVAHPEQLVVVRDIENGNYSYPDYVTMRDGATTVSALMATSSLLRMPVNSGGDTETTATKLVSANYFTSLGVRPALGQLFAGDDDAAATAVISHGYWTRRFNRSTDTLGRVIKVNGVALTIVGVAPANVFGETPGESPDVWASMAVQRSAFLKERGFSWLYLMGRLKPGISAAQAQSDLAARVALDSTVATKQLGSRIVVASGAHGVPRWRDRVGSPLWILAVVVGLVLLIACANLATLLLTRGAARQREIAVRLALGASRGRIVRQLMTEALLLSAIGAVLSVLLAAWGARLLVQMASAVGTGSELTLNLGMDARLLLFLAAISILAGVLFGLTPSIREVRNAGRAMAGTHHRVIAGERPWGLRGALIVIQVALSLVLVAGSVMFLRTLKNLESQDLGFRIDGLLRVEVEPERGYRPPTATISRLVERISGISGVDTATAVGGGTLATMGGVMGLQFDGYTARDDQDRRARADWVGPDYFRTSGIRLAAGRDFSRGDDGAGSRVAIVNQTAARHYFGGDAAALTRRFTFNKKEYEIVGVAVDAKYLDLRETTPRMIYFAMLQDESGMNAIEVRRATGDPSALVPAIRAAVREVDPRLRVGETLTLAARVDRKLGREHLLADLSSLFGALTLLLVSIGVYGTLAYTVGRRVKEIGVRLALGARRAAVIWLVVREVALIVIVGVALGSAGALGVGRLVRSVLFGLQPADALTLATAAGLLMIVALVAGLLPALRASRLDPASVLRE